MKFSPVKFDRLSIVLLVSWMVMFPLFLYWYKFPEKKNNTLHLTVVQTITEPSFYVSLVPIEEDRLRKKLHNEGIYDERMTTIMKNLLRNAPKSLMMDVGANVAYVSLYAAAMGHEVITFEPNPNIIPKIEQSININNFNDRMTLIKAGVSDRNSRLSFHWEQGRYGVGHIEQQGEGTNRENTVSIDIVKLDDYIKRDVLFLKIDVEGQEGRVFLGAMNALKQYHVKYIYVEYVAERIRKTGLDPLEILKMLYDIGYKIYKDPLHPNEKFDRSSLKKIMKGRIDGADDLLLVKEQ